MRLVLDKVIHMLCIVFATGHRIEQAAEVTDSALCLPQVTASSRLPRCLLCCVTDNALCLPQVTVSSRLPRCACVV